MSRITSKLQVTIPKHLAELFGLSPGDEIQWIPDAGTLRVLLPGSRSALTLEERLAHFDLASGQIRRGATAAPGNELRDRGWSREELHERHGDR
jgi:AbrB family looped-hinge helix DNA binding protein